MVVALNDRLYANAKTIFESKGSSLLSKYPLSFVEDVLSHLTCVQTSYNIRKEAVAHGGGTVGAQAPQSSTVVSTGVYYFQGYPSGNFLKQVTTIV